MSITRSNPNTVYLGGRDDQPVIVNDLACSEAITPGHLIERFNNGGIIRWKKSTGNGTAKPAAVALDQPMLNKGVDDDYAANDLVLAAVLAPGETAWMFLASGQNAAAGALLGDNGSVTPGTLKLSPTVALFTALENKNNTAGPGAVRIRVEAL